MVKLALFSYGFRPFFLGVGLAALLVPLWTWSFVSGADLPVAWPPMLWHAHEMLFGFVVAAIAGFLLTAVPSWTGRKGFAGWPLVLLFTVWLLGRLAVGFSGWVPPNVVAVVDLAFLPALLALLAWPLLRERNRNTPLLLVLVALWACNAVCHWALWREDVAMARQALLAGIDIALVLVTVIGGRIVPAFTATALRQAGGVAVPRATKGLTEVAITLMVAVAVVDVLWPHSRWAGAIALLAALVHTLRLSQWQTRHTLRMPVVWVLHLAYAWLPLGLALKALSLLAGAAIAAYWLHALTIGAIATMIVAVMTRASLGHTGRPLRLHRRTVVAYVLLALAVVVRVFGPVLHGRAYPLAVVCSAALWTAAFASFLWVYGPILLGPSVNPRAGR